ncbi:MAG: glutathione S-transferase family protein [Alphaproteobacteria bacterium]|nr:glutathione S-transferase family protein [Alphaproteobacteria bacterium]
MKLYTSIGPNPQVVRTFLAEKGASVPSEDLDIMAGVNRQADYLAINPAGQSPALILDNGDLVTEITAICEYFDEHFDGPRLMGDTPEARAVTRRWVRWVDLNICEPMANGFRFSEGLAMFGDRMRCLPEAADGLKACAQDKLKWLDENWDGRAFIAGDTFTLADILLFSFLSFGEQVGQARDLSLKNVSAWYDRVGARPSVSA